MRAPDAAGGDDVNFMGVARVDTAPAGSALHGGDGDGFTGTRFPVPVSRFPILSPM